MSYIAERQYSNWKGDHHIAVDEEGRIFTNRFGYMECFGGVQGYLGRYQVALFSRPLKRDEDPFFDNKDDAIEYIIRNLNLERIT